MRCECNVYGERQIQCENVLCPERSEEE